MFKSVFKVDFVRVSDLKPVSKALVDYTAQGLVEINGVNAECTIGYIEDDAEYIPTHLFVPAQIVNGVHIEKQTINI